MAESKPSIAVIGLGRMGSGMAQSIHKAGYPLIVWNRSPAKTAPFAQAGAQVAATPREAAAAADIVVSSLLDDDSVLNMMQADDGILAGLPSTECTSVPPRFHPEPAAGWQSCMRITAVIMSPPMYWVAPRQLRRVRWRR